MVPNADAELQHILATSPDLAKEYRENRKLRHDPRVTKVGWFLRRTSIDELPQLLNVLKGDMALVGNRPYLPREKKEMAGHYDEIVKTKPGITGYWQTLGRSDLSFRNRLELEEYYSEHQSFRLDVKILLKTPLVVLFGYGAK